MQLGVRQARDHGAHVAERHELILAHGDRGDRREDAAGVHAMQIDGFGQTNKRSRPIALRILRAAREQVLLDRQHELVFRVAARGAGETRREFLGAAIGGHGQRARQLEALRGVSGFDGELHDAPLHHAPRARHRMRAIRGADDDEPRDAIGKTLTECQRHHAAIGSAGDGAQARDAEMIDEAQQ